MLYHFSEEPNITRFIPREKQNRGDFPAVVWAIDEENEFTYYFPRDCPRIVIRPSSCLSEEDRRLFFGLTTADCIVAIESRWYRAMKETTLYRYSFDEAGFELFDKTAGYYISRETTFPVEVERIDGLLDRLVGKGVELRLMPNLHPLRTAILQSSLDRFGIHRFRNAAPL
ncbi:hypothetical protein N0M98_24770 [Paenibacillus doosanensis]|uniref:DarT domain-containing protein n=1 Tax=Paenibacillus konkukensis TaxID=2020716 RepID=A0ABY4RZW7_9BACL|nr:MULTISPECIES: DUF6886 family protein [Paenibacillus]MCS7463340.1 hypothetical protein [Paenibacillus doosanensis]UQZ87647.1 hypothetical protein SK3146_06949 [Paenibacillus konkukensis]